MPSIAESSRSLLRFQAIRLLAASLLAALGLDLGGPAGAAATPERTAVGLTVDGVIGPAAADYVVRSLGVATDDRAAVVIIELDTPGGLYGSMRDIIRGFWPRPCRSQPMWRRVAPGPQALEQAPDERGRHLLVPILRSGDHGRRAARISNAEGAYVLDRPLSRAA
jgi:hypothetical protein